MRKFMVLAAAAVCSLAASVATAAQIEWTLNNGFMTDGGVVTGSFVWDTSTSSAVSWNLMSSGGTVTTWSPNTYSNSEAGSLSFSIGPTVLFLDLVNDENRRRDLRLGVASLSDLDIAVAQLFLVNQGFAIDGLDENFNYSPPRTQGSQRAAYLSAQVSNVPLPAGGVLLLTGLVGAFAVRKRKAA